MNLMTLFPILSFAVSNAVPVSKKKKKKSVLLGSCQIHDHALFTCTGYLTPLSFSSIVGPNTQATLPPPVTAEEGSTSSTIYPDIIPEGSTFSTIRPVIIPEETTTAEIDISPNIVPCATKDHIINIFKHPTLDSLALENTETRQVEIYTWSHTEEGELMKEVTSMTSIEFRNLYSPTEYVFVGKTLQSKSYHFRINCLCLTVSTVGDP